MLAARLAMAFVACFLCKQPALPVCGRLASLRCPIGHLNHSSL